MGSGKHVAKKVVRRAKLEKLEKTVREFRGKAERWDAINGQLHRLRVLCRVFMTNVEWDELSSSPSALWLCMLEHAWKIQQENESLYQQLCTANAIDIALAKFGTRFGIPSEFQARPPITVQICKPIVKSGTPGHEVIYKAFFTNEEQARQFKNKINNTKETDGLNIYAVLVKGTEP
jgi:hypothetical protein